MRELELLRREFEAVPEPDESTTQGARLLLLDQIEHVTVPARRPRPLGKPRVALAVALAGALLLAGTISLLVRDASVSPADAAVRTCAGAGPASACLKALGRVAGTQVPLSRLTYQRLQELDGPETVTRNKRRFAVLGVVRIELWLDTKRGTGIERTSLAGLRFPSARDRLAWMRSGSPSLRSLFDSAATELGVRAIPNVDTLFFSDLRAWQRATGSAHPERVIPTDPGRALRLLARVWRISGARGPIGALADMPLQDPLLRPAQRAALFSALAQTAGTRRVQLRDPLGRKGTAVIGPSGYNALQWITLFDVHTSRVLAEGVQGRNYIGDQTPPPHRVWLQVFLPAPSATPKRPAPSIRVDG